MYSTAVPFIVNRTQTIWRRADDLWWQGRMTWNARKYIYIFAKALEKQAQYATAAKRGEIHLPLPLKSLYLVRLESGILRSQHLFEFDWVQVRSNVNDCVYNSVKLRQRLLFNLNGLYISMHICRLFRGVCVCNQCASTWMKFCNFSCLKVTIPLLTKLK